jgi:beta-glucosidase
MPIWQLAGFTRIHLQPGESRRVSFSITPEQLRILDSSGRAVPGEHRFRIALGGCLPEAASSLFGRAG